MRIGAKIRISEFNYTNKAGGTGQSHPFGHRFDDYEYFEKNIDVIITKIWDDYETGIKGWGKPDPKNKELMEYLERNCKEGHHVFFDSGKGYLESEWVDQEGEFVIFWSQWDII